MSHLRAQLGITGNLKYSWVMYPELHDLEDLIAQAEAGDIKGARERLRIFTKRSPSTLLAWKWLADLAESAKERSAAIRRAQLLAPGDPWVIEAKKHRMPMKTKRLDGKKQSVTSPDAVTRVPAAVSAEHEPVDDVQEEVIGNGAGVSTLVGEYTTGGGGAPAQETTNVSRVRLEEGQDVSRKMDSLAWVAIGLGAAGLIMISVAWNLGAF